MVAWLGEKLAACEQQAAALTALLGFGHLLWLVATKTDVHKRLTPASHHLVRNGRALWGGVSRQRCEGLHLATYFMWGKSWLECRPHTDLSDTGLHVTVVKCVVDSCSSWCQ